MNDNITLTLGIIGMILILIGFLLNQCKKLSQDIFLYDFINALGSLLLVIYAFDGKAWPFVILNSIWFVYSVKDLLQKK